MKLSLSVLSLVAGLWLVGCGAEGGESGSAFSSGGSVPIQSTISGRVISERGTPEAGVRVIVHARTNNARSEAISAADGTFLLPVTAGVYDIMLNREGDSQSASCYFGPVEPAGSSRDFILHASNGRPVNSIFGKLSLTDGVPAVNRKVNLNVANALNEKSLPLSASGRTQSDGSFDLTIATENLAGVDLEIFDGSENLDEFADFSFLQKPVYLEFVSEQNSVENVQRAGHNPPPDASVGPVFAKSLTSGFLYDFRKSNERELVASRGYLAPDGIDHSPGELIELSEPIALRQLFQQVASEGVLRRGAGDWGSRNTIYCKMPVPCVFSFLFFRTSATLAFERTYEAADFANFVVRSGGEWNSARLPDNLDENGEMFLVLSPPR